jgi:hypothetical protein
MRTSFFIIAFLLCFLLWNCNDSSSKSSLPDSWFTYTDQFKPRWSSPENLNGLPGQGGKENNGAKGHAFDGLKAGEALVLLDTKGSGVISRIWLTIRDRSPKMLRSLKVEMFWDGESKPAVASPVGDFFGVSLGRTAVMSNAFFLNPEGRSFVCQIPMPYKTGAKIVITNESDTDLSHLFFDVDFLEAKTWSDDWLYFHTYWSRDTATTLAHDFEMLPAVMGKGRFMGVNVGINANPIYGQPWWGEGEVKMYLDGGGEYPTLVGTGTEDYIGTGWGQGQYFTPYMGCPVADEEKKQWSYYRFHVPDPIYFSTDLRVTIQQMGGNMRKDLVPLQEKNIPLIPVTMDDAGKIIRFYSQDSVVNLKNPQLPEAWTNFYRSDDVCATAYFYLATPSSNLPKLQPVEYRTFNLKE